MPAPRLQVFWEILRPWRARIAVWVPASAGAYQFGCDQLGWPTLPVLWGMTGEFFPWWAWLLVAHVGFTYALFEYVRLNPQPPSTPLRDGISDDGRLSEFEKRLENLATQVAGVRLETQGATKKVNDLRVFAAAPEKIAALKKLKESLTRFPSPHEYACDGSSARDNYKDLFESLENLGETLNAAGVLTRDEFQAKAKEREAAIRSDAINCSVQPNEVDCFRSGYEKQAYMVARAKVYLARDQIDGAIASLEAEHKAASHRLLSLAKGNVLDGLQ